MQTRGYKLKDGKVLIIRAAIPDDAPSILTFVEALSGQTDFLTFGPGEFGYTEAQERAFIRSCELSPNALFLIAFGFVLVLLLHFSLVISRLAEQTKVLAQRVGLLQYEVDQLRAQLGERAAAEVEEPAELTRSR
jgi:hypothetical protein